MGITVGSKAWVFDVNLRVYSDTERSGPIWLKHWRETAVVGETSRSWVLKNGEKVSKKDGKYGVCFSWEEVEREAWVHDNAYKIADRVMRERNYGTLLAVARVIGYEPQ